MDRTKLFAAMAAGALTVGLSGCEPPKPPKTPADIFRDCVARVSSFSAEYAVISNFNSADDYQVQVVATKDPEFNVIYTIDQNDEPQIRTSSKYESPVGLSEPLIAVDPRDFERVKSFIPLVRGCTYNL